MHKIGNRILDIWIQPAQNIGHLLPHNFPTSIQYQAWHSSVAAWLLILETKKII